MSFTQLAYDPCTYEKRMMQSVGPGDYMIGTPSTQCSTCISGDPWLVSAGGVSVCEDRPLIDVDSELHNLTRPATNCPAGLYRPAGPFCKPHNYPDCRVAVATEDCRLTNPPCTLRGTGWNRWAWLCQDPQDQVQMPFDWNIDSKLVAKDNHRPCIPSPMDQSKGLPTDDGTEVMWSPESPFKLDDQRVPRVDWRSCSTLRAT